MLPHPGSLEFDKSCLAALPGITVDCNNSVWLIKFDKEPNLSVELTVPTNCGEWFVEVSDKSTGTLLWSDQAEVYSSVLGVTAETAGELQKLREEGISQFVRQMLTLQLRVAEGGQEVSARAQQSTKQSQGGDKHRQLQWYKDDQWQMVQLF